MTDSMHIKIQIKDKESGNWDLVNAADVRGPTFRDVLVGFVNKKVIIEVDVDGEKFLSRMAVKPRRSGRGYKARREAALPLCL